MRTIRTLLLTLAIAMLAVTPAYAEPWLASWYGPGLYGNSTACGQTLTEGSWLVAHPSLPCGTQLTISYGGATVTAPVGDRGPYVGGRDIDLGPGVASALGFTGVDVVDVSVGGASAASASASASAASVAPRASSRRSAGKASAASAAPASVSNPSPGSSAPSSPPCVADGWYQDGTWYYFC